VVDVIRDGAGSITVRGFVPSSDSFSSNETSVELSTRACNLQPACTANTIAVNGPACSLYPLDMAFAGNAEGLVTDRWAGFDTSNLYASARKYTVGVRVTDTIA